MRVRFRNFLTHSIVWLFTQIFILLFYRFWMHYFQVEFSKYVKVELQNNEFIFSFFFQFIFLLQFAQMMSYVNCCNFYSIYIVYLKKPIWLLRIGFWDEWATTVRIEHDGTLNKYDFCMVVGVRIFTPPLPNPRLWPLETTTSSYEKRWQVEISFNSCLK